MPINCRLSLKMTTEALHDSDTRYIYIYTDIDIDIDISPQKQILSTEWLPWLETT